MKAAFAWLTSEGLINLFYILAFFAGAAEHYDRAAFFIGMACFFTLNREDKA